MMKSKEALEKMSTKQVAIELFNIVSNGEYDMNEIVPYFDRIDKAIAELEQLKRDVKRYFDLGYIEVPSTEQFKEYLKLQEKLLKVGKNDDK